MRLRLIAFLVVAVLVLSVSGGRHRKDKKERKQKKARKNNNNNNNNNNQGVRCGVQYYTVQDTQYQTSCSNNYKTECSTTYQSQCTSVPQTTVTNQCSVQSSQEPVSICTNEVLEVDCIVGGQRGKRYKDHGNQNWRQGVGAIKKVETCVPIHSHSERQECRQSPQQTCRQVPSKTCSQAPVTVNRQVARRVCG